MIDFKLLGGLGKRQTDGQIDIGDSRDASMSANHMVLKYISKLPELPIQNFFVLWSTPFF